MIGMAAWLDAAIIPRPRRRPPSLCGQLSGSIHNRSRISLAALQGCNLNLWNRLSPIMPIASFSILACIDGDGQFPDGRFRCVVRRGGAMATWLMLTLTTLLSAQGQEVRMPSMWWAGESSRQWAFEDTAQASEVIAGYVPDQDVAGLPSVPDGETETRRNRALEIVRRRDEYAVRRYRQGFLQRFRLSGSWIGQTNDDGLGISGLDTSLTVAIPLGSFENLLLVTPGFKVDYLNGPADVDTPPRLYDVGLDLMWRKQFNDRWGSMVAVRPAVSSDFKTSDDAIRMTGRALATWQWVPERLSLLFGVVYLDRNDLPVLPGVGLIWTPSPEWRLDATFPRPKLARRVAFVPRQREDWVYLSGRLGGRTWAVERQPGVSDQLTLRDYRLSLGWERMAEGGAGWFVEAGYVFGRELEYEVVPLTRSFGDSVIVSGGLTY